MINGLYLMMPNTFFGVSTHFTLHGSILMSMAIKNAKSTGIMDSRAFDQTRAIAIAMHRKTAIG